MKLVSLTGLSNWNTCYRYVCNVYFSIGLQPNIGNWDTSSVDIMNQMFRGASAFNQSIGNWDTSNVTVMSSMFQDAASFNQPVGVGMLQM